MEKKTEVKTFLVDYLCDDCGEKVHYVDGNMLLTYPPQFRHTCKGCGREYVFFFKYPYTSHEYLNKEE